MPGCRAGGDGRGQCREWPKWSGQAGRAPPPSPQHSPAYGTSIRCSVWHQRKYGQGRGAQAHSRFPPAPSLTPPGTKWRQQRPFTRQSCARPPPLPWNPTPTPSHPPLPYATPTPNHKHSYHSPAPPASCARPGPAWPGPALARDPLLLLGHTSSMAASMHACPAGAWWLQLAWCSAWWSGLCAHWRQGGGGRKRALRTHTPPLLVLAAA